MEDTLRIVREVAQSDGEVRAMKLSNPKELLENLPSKKSVLEISL